MDVLMKAELSLKKSQLSSQIFAVNSIKQTSIPTPEKTSLAELAQQILMSECRLAS